MDSSRSSLFPLLPYPPTSRFPPVHCPAHILSHLLSAAKYLLHSFWSYELSKRALTNPEDTHTQSALKVLLCGGLAGVVTWVSIFPLDVVKTRVQTWDLHHGKISPALPSTAGTASQPLLGTSEVVGKRPSTFAIAKAAYHADGSSVFFRGLGICSARAFIVNAVQWAVYEWMMRVLQRP